MYDQGVCIIAPITDIKSKHSSVAAIRISGNKAIILCNKIFSSKNLEQQPSHSIHFGKIIFEGAVIDEVLVSIFKAPNSYTGENIVEISCHASSFIVQKIIEIFISMGARAALAGEFTKRAFFNGKIDLLQAESIAALISSKNRYEHEAAIKLLTGHLSVKIKKLRDDLIRVKSLIELEIDFAEDHHLNINNINNLKLLVNKVKSNILSLLEGFKNRKNNKAQIVIIGDPNVGKSSLFNAIINEDRAIVSNISGTTRDIVSENIVINDIEFTINDTAGLRATNDTVEKIGINKAYEKIKSADIILYVFDIVVTSIEQLKEKIKDLENNKLFLIASKSDTFDKNDYEKFISSFPQLLFVSSVQNTGIKIIKEKIFSFIDKAFSYNSNVLINARHYGILSDSVKNLDEVTNMLSKQPLAYELIAFELNEAIVNLKAITGEITNDDYLTEIFSNFCIGK